MGKGRFAVFFLIVLTIWTAINAYVLWRIWSLPFVQRSIPRPLLLGIAVFLWSSYLAARWLEHAGIPSLAVALEWLGAHWLGAVFLAFVCLLIVDIVTGFGHWLPAQRLRTYALLPAAVLVIIALLQARRAPVVNQYSVSLKDLPAELDGTTLAVISDTHLGTMIGADWVDARVAQVQALRPDLIILAGDIIEGDDANEAQIAAGLRKLSAPLGVWAVTGNHEFFAGLPHSLKLLNQAGARVLRDESVEVRPGLILAGVDDLTARRRYRRDGDFIERALAKRPPGATVLLSHSPMYPERAAAAGANLMISGHTHSGQIWPFTYFVQSIYPLVHGRYEVNGMTAIVCRGTGTWGPRMRLWGPRRDRRDNIAVRSAEQNSR